MGKLSRTKGKVGEREIRDACKLHLCSPDTCRRGQQRSGTECADVIDVMPDAHVECKRYKAAACHKWLLQAESDAKPGELPIVVYRVDRDTEPVVMFRLRDSQAFAARLAANMGRPIFPHGG